MAETRSLTASLCVVCVGACVCVFVGVGEGDAAPDCLRQQSVQSPDVSRFLCVLCWVCGCVRVCVCVCVCAGVRMYAVSEVLLCVHHACSYRWPRYPMLHLPNDWPHRSTDRLHVCVCVQRVVRVHKQIVLLCVSVCVRALCINRVQHNEILYTPEHHLLYTVNML